MAKILIKRTSGTTKPSTVDAGELVYAYGSGGDYGGKLFLGHGSNSSSSPVIVGGELYTNMLDHTAGTTTASSAIITDANNKIDTLKIKNQGALQLDEPTSAGTNYIEFKAPDAIGSNLTYTFPASVTNGYYLQTNGSGVLSWAQPITTVTAGVGLSGGGTSGSVSLAIDGSELTDMTAAVDGTADEMLLLDSSAGTTNRKRFAEINLGQFNNDQGWTANAGDITAVVAGTGLTGGATSGSATVTLADTSVTAASYGSSTQIPVITVDAQGRLTAASVATAASSGTLTVDGDTGTQDVTLSSDDLQILGTNNQLTATVTKVGTDVKVTMALANNVTIAGDLTVNGTTTTIATTNTTVADTLLELGTGTSGTPANDSGIVIERGSADNAFIGYDESADKFTLGTGSFTGATTGNLSITTGTLVAHLEDSSVAITGGSITGITDLAVADGGTGLSAVAKGSVLVANTVNTLSALDGGGSSDGALIYTASSDTISWGAIDGGTYS